MPNEKTQARSSNISFPAILGQTIEPYTDEKRARRTHIVALSQRTVPERKNVHPSAPKTCQYLSLAPQARLRRFARHGSPDTRDLGGKHRQSSPDTEISSSRSSLGRRKRGSLSPSKSNATPNNTTTKRTGPYDRAFQQHLINHGILPLGYGYPDGRVPPEPMNMDEIPHALEQPKASLTPSQFIKTRRKDRPESVSQRLPISEGQLRLSR
ncbi:hypothetical protein AUP68_06264 [Ilyonectria robusta]